MKKMIIGLLFTMGTLLAVELGKVPVAVKISGENGGKLDGSS